MLLNNVFKILSTILKKAKYLVIALVVTILFAAISYYLTVVNVYHKSIFIYAEMNGTYFTIISLILGLVISVLFGLYIALLVFRREIVKLRAAGNKATSTTGIVTGILASGCPSCGAPILGFFGLPLGLFSLPLRGIELKLLSIVFLTLSIYLITKNIEKNLACQCS